MLLHDVTAQNIATSVRHISQILYPFYTLEQCLKILRSCFPQYSHPIS
jgi:hypothetical protein